jgi:hypothetical protein
MDCELGILAVAIELHDGTDTIGFVAHLFAEPVAAGVRRAGASPGGAAAASPLRAPPARPLEVAGNGQVSLAKAGDFDGL